MEMYASGRSRFSKPHKLYYGDDLSQYNDDRLLKHKLENRNSYQMYNTFNIIVKN